jgi:hypothetical protein
MSRWNPTGANLREKVRQPVPRPCEVCLVAMDQAGSHVFSNRKTLASEASHGLRHSAC